MYLTPTERPKAVKRHQCTWCAEFIEPGETYVRWASADGGGMFANKMHPECHAGAEDDSDGYEWEYTPFSGERPRTFPTTRSK